MGGTATTGSRPCCNPRFTVNQKRVEWLWRREGLKLPQRPPKGSRLWLNDGSCVRLRPERKDHLWSYVFVQARIRDGRASRVPTLIDESTLEGTAAAPARDRDADDVVQRLSVL